MVCSRNYEFAAEYGVSGYALGRPIKEERDNMVFLTIAYTSIFCKFSAQAYLPHVNLRVIARYHVLISLKRSEGSEIFTGETP